MSLAESFPQPSPLIVDALDQLRLAAVRPPDNESALRRLAMLPCPWDPAACPPELRELLYVWFDAVVAWINEEHSWRLDRVIPICWTQHPHIVHELATVACLRWEADYAVTAATLDEGYRYNLPMFLDRLAIRVGPTGCLPGNINHIRGQARNTLYRAHQEAWGRRGRHRQADTSGDASLFKQRGSEPQ
jgi:hypothetical protein